MLFFRDVRSALSICFAWERKELHDTVKMQTYGLLICIAIIAMINIPSIEHLDGNDFTLSVRYHYSRWLMIGADRFWS